MSDNVCSNCGLPNGDHYNLCFNSVHFYSPEQERYDDQFYGEDDNRERYAATVESSQYDDLPRHFCEFCGRDDTDEPEGCHCANGRALPAMTVAAVLKHKNTVNNDDIPF